MQSVKQPLIHALVGAPQAVCEGDHILAAICPGEFPRERLARLGPQALKDHELLAVVLGCGLSGVSCGESGAKPVGRLSKRILGGDGYGATGADEGIVQGQNGDFSHRV